MNLDTPGGAPNSAMSIAYIREQMGIKDKPRSRYTTDTDSVEFYETLVEYYYRSRRNWTSGWRVCEDEYNMASERDERVYDMRQLEPSRAYSLVSTIESMVLANRPKFFVKGFTAKDQETKGPVLEDISNNEWQQNFRMVKETRLCARDCATYGFGVMLSSFEGDFDPEEIEDSAEAMREMTVTDSATAMGAAMLEAELAEIENAMGPEELEETYEGVSGIYRGKVVSRRVSPWSFLIDPDCTRIEDAKWVGRCIVSDLESVKADPTFENTADLSPNFTFEIDGRMRERDQQNYLDGTVPYDLVYLYEVFYRKPDGGWKMMVFAEGHKTPLRVVEDPYWIGCPYQVLQWNNNGESFFVQSDVQIALSEIVAERLLLSKVFDGYMREQMDTTFYDGSLGISEEELYAAGDPNVGKFVKISGTHQFQTLQAGFFKLPKDTKSPEALNVLAMIERSIQVSSGLGPNQFGQALKSGTTATEAAEVGTFSRSRGAHKFSAMEEFIASVAYARLGLMAQFYTASDIHRIAGQQAAAVWAECRWTRSDVQHGLNIIVEPGSTRQESEDLRTNQLITMLSMIMQNPAAQALFDVPALYRELFRRMGFHEGSKFLLMQDGQQFAQQAAQLNAMQIAAGMGPQGGGSPPSIPGGETGQQLAGGV